MANQFTKFIIFTLALLIIQEVHLLKTLQISSADASWIQVKNVQSNLCLSLNSNEAVILVKCDEKESLQIWKQSMSTKDKKTSISLSNMDGKFLTQVGGEGSSAMKFEVKAKNDSPSQTFSSSSEKIIYS